MKFYAEKFKRIRQLKKISMQNVTDIANISRVSLWTWEKGKRIPSEANIRALARAINTDITEVSDLKPVKESMIKDFSKPVQSLLEIANFDTVKRDHTMKQLKYQIDMLDNKLNHTSTIINALISSLDTAFYIKDTNQRFIIANNSFLKMLKLNANMIVTGKRDIDLFPAKEAKINNALDIKVISTGKPNTGVENFIPGTRKQKWGLISRIPISERAGKIIGIIGIFVDITERKNLESELDKNHEQLEYLVTKRTSDLEKRTHELNKRVKELNCLCEISKLVDTPNISLFGIYQGIVDLLPLAWQYPERTSARLSINKIEYVTSNFSESKCKLESSVTIEDKIVGTLEIYYNNDHEQGDIDPFSKEERALLNVITERLRGIAERILTEKILIKSERRFKEISFSLAGWLWEINEKGVFTYCSENVSSILGYSKNEMLGKTIFHFMSQKEAKRQEKIFKKFLETKQPVVDLENWNICKDGKEVCLLTNGTPFFDYKENLIGYRGVDKNITESKKVLNMLKESEEKFRMIFDNATDGMVLAEPDGKKFTLANKAFCEMLGYNKDDIKIIGISEVHPVEDIPYITEQFRKQVTGELSLAKNLRVKAKNGNIFYVDINVKLVELNGKSYMLGIFRKL